MSLIEIKNVYKIYNEGRESQVNALDGVSLTIDQGEFVAIIGTSGSGKSTMMNILGCLDMQKRMVSVLTSAALWLAVLASAVGLALPASAATVGDVEEAVAVLTGLGIVSGYSDGLYHPEDGLTRAQFCKLAILAEGHGDQAAGSSYRSLFTDVSAADWALSYINLAYEEGLMAGKGDGTFGPGEAVTLEQAVTVCLRLLGYTDKDIGPFWPEDYLSKAGKLGLLNGVSANGSDALDRGQAALLLYNLIQLENAQGKVFGLGLGASSVSDAVLLDNDAEAADGTLRTAKVYIQYQQSPGAGGDAGKGQPQRTGQMFCDGSLLRQRQRRPECGLQKAGDSGSLCQCKALRPGQRSRSGRNQTGGSPKRRSPRS